MVGAVVQIVSGLLNGVQQLAASLFGNLINLISEVINPVLNIITSLKSSILRASLSSTINTLITQINNAQAITALIPGKKDTLSFVQYLLRVELAKLENNSVPIDLVQASSYVAGLQEYIVTSLASTGVSNCPSCTSPAIPIKNCVCYTSSQLQTFLGIFFSQFLPIAKQLGSIQVGPNTPAIGTDFFTNDQGFYFYVFNNYGNYNLTVLQSKLDAYAEAVQELSAEFKANFGSS